MENASKTHLKFKSRENSFAHNVLFSFQIWIFTESITVVLCANFQNDLATEIDVLDERDFAGNISLRRVSGGYLILQQPSE